MSKKYGSLFHCFHTVSIRNKPDNRDLMGKIALSPNTFSVALLGPVAVLPNRARGPSTMQTGNTSVFVC